jgi:uncharacterized protein YndB with AHSA1/START domain
MPDILHRVGVRGTTTDVYKALSTVDGLSHWWMLGAKGKPKAGGTIRFPLEGGGFDMKVVESKPGKIVKWKCVGGPDEWIGTEITFRLQAKRDQTVILFTHAGWRKAVEFMHHCSTKWAVFLLSLKRLDRKRRGSPASVRREDPSGRLILGQPGSKVIAYPRRSFFDCRAVAREDRWAP